MVTTDGDLMGIPFFFGNPINEDIFDMEIGMEDILYLHPTRGEDSFNSCGESMKDINEDPLGILRRSFMIFICDVHRPNFAQIRW